MCQHEMGVVLIMGWVWGCGLDYRVWSQPKKKGVSTKTYRERESERDNRETERTADGVVAIYAKLFMNENTTSQSGESSFPDADESYDLLFKVSKQLAS